MKKSQVMIIAGLMSTLSLVGLPQTVLADGDQIIDDGTTSETDPANPDRPTQGGVSSGVNQGDDGAGEYNGNVDFGWDDEPNTGNTDPSTPEPGASSGSTTSPSNPSSSSNNQNATPNSNHHANPIAPSGNNVQNSRPTGNAQPQANSAQPQDDQADAIANEDQDAPSANEQATEDVQQPEASQSQDGATQQAESHQPFWDLMVIFLIVAGCLAVATGLIAMAVNKLSQHKMEKLSNSQPQTGLTLEKHTAQKEKKSKTKSKKSDK